jgi:hypothetical protein
VLIQGIATRHHFIMNASVRNRRDHKMAERLHADLQDALSKYKSAGDDVQRSLREFSALLSDARRIIDRQPASVVEVLRCSVGRSSLRATREGLLSEIGAAQKCAARFVDSEIRKRSRVNALNDSKQRLRGFVGGCLSTSEVQERIDRVDFRLITGTMHGWGEWLLIQEHRVLKRNKALLSSFEPAIAAVESRCRGDGVRCCRFARSMLESDEEKTLEEMMALGRREAELRHQLGTAIESSLLLCSLSSKLPASCAVLVRRFCAPLPVDICTHSGPLCDVYKELRTKFDVAESECSDAVMDEYDDDCCSCPMCSGRDNLWLGPRKGQKDRELFLGSMQNAKWQGWCCAAAGSPDSRLVGSH